MPYTDFNWITDRLAVGGLVHSYDAEFPFDAVLSLHTDAPPSVRAIVQSGTVEYQWHSIIDGLCHEDNDAIVRRFGEAADQIAAWDHSGKRVLVHCVAGVSRSATGVIWYLVRHRGYSWDTARALVHHGRPQINPNVRFEIPLRLAAGEPIDEDWARRRVEEYCSVIATRDGVGPSPEEVWRDLESQGTVDVLHRGYFQEGVSFHLELGTQAE